jgi:hypothetical protein
MRKKKRVPLRQHYSDSERHLMVRKYLESGQSKVDFWRSETGKKDHGLLLHWMRELGYLGADGVERQTPCDHTSLATNLTANGAINRTTRPVCRCASSEVSFLSSSVILAHMRRCN